MLLTQIVGHNTYSLQREFENRFKHSRFTIRTMEVRTVRGLPAIYFKGITLKAAKDFCGSHPAACKRLHSSHRKSRFLEGADWVEFFDKLNDLLDEERVSCNIECRGLEFRGTFYHRIGLYRRTRYRHIDGSSPFQNGNWDTSFCDDDFEMGFDTVKQPVRPSEFPEGTPGIHEQQNYHVEG